MAKRQRLAIELPEVGSAALPAVCYLPGVLSSGDGGFGGSSSSSVSEGIQYLAHAKVRSGVSVQLVQASLGDVEYVGRSDGDENMGVQPCCYALGVYRPGESKLQLVSVAGERIFRLDSRLTGLVYAPTGAGADEDATAREMRKLANKRLVDEFGSTRRRRQLTAREAGVVAADRISGGDAVQEMLGGVAAKGQDAGLTKEEMQRRAFAQRTVPPHNPFATTAATAYPLELLLGPSDSGGGEHSGAPASSLIAELNVAQIHRLAEDDEELSKARDKGAVHAYVLTRLGPLRPLKLSEDPATVARAKARARYLALLAALLKVQARPVLAVKEEELEGLARELRLREGLAGLVLERFYVRTSDPLRGVRYERPDAQKQLLLSYILAVAVMAEEGFMDKEQFEELRSSLKMDASKLANAMQQIGCHTKSAKCKVDRDGHIIDVPSFVASLLRQQDPTKPKTLADCFPTIKLAKAKAGGR
ncbi:hypothetical protein TSOC_010193 [Tetrabaena socialis]|uniref:DNA-directed RNA polymerase I subunit rpa49 n=1 Tax=Tetrabaena socialis TaxID=47790 RepID=A0A2J7ZTW7_9CHLO|nr:hypothetical protein TSOC_010193 [Tetrabaena socialis]|eukprot:PNH03717.1 hypothetical protein TSOC_010193 [Tetrabaena socialis]